MKKVVERKRLRVNVGKSIVMRCSRYGNGGRMHVILNGELTVRGMAWIVLSTWGRKCQLIDDVKEMWYTE